MNGQQADTTQRLPALLALNFRFAMNRDTAGMVVALIGVRVHHSVIDIIAVYGEHDADATHIPDEVDIPYPHTTLWHTTGSAGQAIDNVLGPAHTDTRRVEHPARLAWLTARQAQQPAEPAHPHARRTQLRTAHDPITAATASSTWAGTTASTRQQSRPGHQRLVDHRHRDALAAAARDEWIATLNHEAALIKAQFLAAARTQGVVVIETALGDLTQCHDELAATAQRSKEQPARDEVAGGVAELGGDEVVESFGVGFDAAGFFAVFPGVVVLGIGGGDDADAVGAGGFGDVGDGVFEVVGLVGGDVEQDVGVGGGAAVGEGFVDGLDVDGVSGFDLEGGDFEVLAGDVWEGCGPPRSRCRRRLRYRALSPPRTAGRRD